MAYSDALEQSRLATALARAQGTCNGLGNDSQVRSKMESFLGMLAPKLLLDRTHRGDRPSMIDAGLRRRVVDDLMDGHPLKIPRGAAFDRVEELLEEGWPRLSRTQIRGGWLTRRVREPLAARFSPARAHVHAFFRHADAPTAASARSMLQPVNIRATNDGITS